MVFENILNPVFAPFLALPTLWAVLLLSFLISLIITLIYKYSTDQNLMKSLKDEMKELQKEIKELFRRQYGMENVSFWASDV